MLLMRLIRRSDRRQREKAHVDPSPPMIWNYRSRASSLVNLVRCGFTFRGYFERKCIATQPLPSTPFRFPAVHAPWKRPTESSFERRCTPLNLDLRARPVRESGQNNGKALENGRPRGLMETHRASNDVIGTRRRVNLTSGGSHEAWITRQRLYPRFPVIYNSYVSPPLPFLEKLLGRDFGDWRVKLTPCYTYAHVHRTGVYTLRVLCFLLFNFDNFNFDVDRRDILRHTDIKFFSDRCLNSLFIRFI